MSLKKMILLCTMLGLTNVVVSCEVPKKKSIMVSFWYKIMKPFRKKTHVSQVVKQNTKLSTKRVEPVVFGEITESLVRKYKSIIDEFIQRDATVENNEIRTLLKQLRQYMNYDVLKRVSLPELMRLIPKSQLQQHKSVIQTFVKNDTQRENKDIKHMLQHMLSMMK